MLKGYVVYEGYVGFISNNETMLFSTEAEYEEYMSDVEGEE